MDIDTFWDIIDAARASAGPGKPFHEALVDHLATRTRQDILQYQERFDEVHAALHLWDVWAAAYPIGGGCSDDSFMDFRAGLIAQGRDWYQKAAASPYSLGGHPAAASTVHRPWDNALFYEEVNYAASYAFERVSGDDHGFYDAWDRYSASRNQSDRSPQTWARTSTSMMPSRCAAACPGSPPSACAMAPPEQNWSFCITRRRRNRAPTVARNRRYTGDRRSPSPSGRITR